MASDPGVVQYVIDQAGLGDRLSQRKMFGEYALYLDEKVVALVCDNQLFVKPTAEGRSLLGTVDEHAPFPGAKLWFRIGDTLEDGEALRQLLRTTAHALPAPGAKPRPKQRVRR